MGTSSDNRQKLKDKGKIGVASQRTVAQTGQVIGQGLRGGG